MSAATESRVPPQTAGRTPAARTRDFGGIVCFVASLVAAAVVVDAFFWSAGRGFDLTDESFHLNTLRHVDVAPQGGSQFASVVRILTLGRTLTVPEYRLLGFVLLQISAIAAAIAFVRFVRVRLAKYEPHLPATGVVVATAMLGAMLGYSWLPRTVSYLVLTPALLNVAAVVALVLLTRPSSGFRVAWLDVLGSIALGVVVSLLFFTKFSSAVAGLAVVGLSILLLDGWRRAFVIGGIAATSFLVVTVALDATKSFSISELFQRASALGGGSHSASALRHAYVTELRDLLPAVVVGSIGLGLVMGSVLLILRGRGGWRFVLAAIGAVLGALLFTRVMGGSRPPWDLSVVVVYSALGALAAVVVLGLGLERLGARSSGAGFPGGTEPVTRSHDEVRQWCAVATLFVGLPLAGALGTNTGLLKMSLSCGALLALGAIVLFTVWRAALPREREKNALVAVPLVIVLACGAFVVGRSLLNNLYRVPVDAGRETHVVPGAAPLQGLRVDAPTRDALQRIISLASRPSKLPAGSPILTSANLEGLAYALDGYVPGSGWIDASPTTCERLRKSRAELAATKVVIVSDQIGRALDACFRQTVPGYPVDFQRLGTVDLGPSWKKEIGVRRVEVLRRKIEKQATG